MDQMSNKGINITKLVGFLVANISNNDQEWKEWGVPFLEMVMASQGIDSSLEPQILKEINSLFCAICGAGGKFVCVEEIVESDKVKNINTLEKFVVVQSAADWWSTMTQSQSLEEELQEFLHTFMIWVSDHGSYDARARVVAKHIFTLLQDTPEKFSTLEKQLLSQDPTVAAKFDDNDRKSSDTSNAVDNLFSSVKSNDHHASTPSSTHHFFTKHAEDEPGIFRLWRISLAAVVGATLITLSTSVAPALYSALAMWGAEGITWGQVCASAMAMLTSVGVATAGHLTHAKTSLELGYTVGKIIVNRPNLPRQFQLEHLPRLPQNIKEETSDIAKPLYDPPLFIFIPGHSQPGCVLESTTWGADVFPLLDTALEDHDADISDEGTNATVGTRVGTWVTEASTRLLTTLTPLISQPAHADAFDDSHMPVSTSMMTAGEQEIVLEYREVEEDLHYQYVTVTLPTDTTDPQTDAAFVPLPPVSPPNSTDDKAANSEKKVHEQTSTPAPVVDKEAAVERKGQGWWAKSVPCGEEYLLHWDPEVRNACQFSIRNFLASESETCLEQWFMSTGSAEWMSWASATDPGHIVQSFVGTLDSPWATAVARAEETGKKLAGHLMAPRLAQQQQHSGLHGTTSHTNSIAWQDDKAHRQRAVTLIGYGIGARVVCHCLEALSKHGELGQGLVENAVLLGTPYGVSSTSQHLFWKTIRGVVAGRFINCYSKNDWLLALLYRSQCWELGNIAGLQPIDSAALTPSSVMTSASATATAGMNSHIEVMEEPHTHTHDSTDLKKSEDDEDSIQEQVTLVSDKLVENEHSEHASPFVSWRDSFENVDVSTLIRNHSDYSSALPLILPLLHLDDA